ncbi:MAG: ATP-binding protein, partial [Pseudohongiellaceae bacterium]
CLRYANNIISIQVQLNNFQITIRICDDGPGIPENMTHSIFEPFSRQDTSRDKSSGGYGLGLAIARRIMQRHRGSISVSNSSPKGACFTLQWPRRPELEANEDH